MVVHREPEEDGEEEERQPGLDRVHLRKAEELVADAFLEDQHDQAVRGTDREQVEQDRLRRHDERAERDGQQHEAEAEHEREHEREPVLHQLAVVDDLGRLAGHVRPRAGAGQRVRDDRGTQPLDRLHGGLVAAVAGHERLDHARCRHSARPSSPARGTRGRARAPPGAARPPRARRSTSRRRRRRSRRCRPSPRRAPARARGSPASRRTSRAPCGRRPSRCADRARAAPA